MLYCWITLTQQTHTTKELLWLIYHLYVQQLHIWFLFAHLRFAVCFHYLLQATFISGGSLWSNILILTEDDFPVLPTIRSKSYHIHPCILDFLTDVIHKSPEDVTWDEMRLLDGFKITPFDQNAMNAVISHYVSFTIYVLHKPWMRHNFLS